MCACTHGCASRSAGVEECARLPKSHGVGPSVMDAQLDADINRDATQPPHDMYRVHFLFFLKHIKYTICFPWPPPSGPLLFALPTVSEPTLDAKSWHAFQRSDSWWGRGGGHNRCQRAANSSPGFCPRETGQSDKQEMKTQRFRGGRNRTRADCLDFRGFGSFPCFFFLIFS